MAKPVDGMDFREAGASKARRSEDRRDTYEVITRDATENDRGRTRICSSRRAGFPTACEGGPATGVSDCAAVSESSDFGSTTVTTSGIHSFNQSATGSMEKRIHYAATFAVLATAALAFSLLQSLILPAIPLLEHTLDTTTTGATWLLTGYLLSAAIATPILGRIGDMVGKEKMIVIVLVTLSVGTLISALATTFPVMLAGRIVQGAGGAVFPLAFGIIRDEFPSEKVAGAIGVLSAILGVGVGAGIVLAGPIVGHLSYHWLFWMPLFPVSWSDGDDVPFRARVTGPVPWSGQLVRRLDDVGLVGYRADRRLLRAHMGMEERLGARAFRRHRRVDSVLDPFGGAFGHADGRHEDDEDPGSVEHKFGRPAVRLRDVRHICHRAPVLPDAGPDWAMALGPRSPSRGCTSFHLRWPCWSSLLSQAASPSPLAPSPS